MRNAISAFRQEKTRLAAVSFGCSGRCLQKLAAVAQTMREVLWVAKTSTATKNETVLGREGLNTILASTQREDFGGQEPV
jgi:hypothetical protein